VLIPLYIPTFFSPNKVLFTLYWRQSATTTGTCVCHFLLLVQTITEATSPPELTDEMGGADNPNSSLPVGPSFAVVLFTSAVDVSSRRRPVCCPANAEDQAWTSLLHQTFLDQTRIPAPSHPTHRLLLSRG